jgi:hypothetical protein
VSKPGFEALEQGIDVPGGNESTVAITFVALVPAARLVISAERAATIFVDQKAVARGRFDGRVPSGLHDVQVSANGKRPYLAQVTLADGDVKALDVMLVDAPRPFPWPWIAAGAVAVAGAAVGGYFVFKHDNAGGPTGSLGTVSLSR